MDLKIYHLKWYVYHETAICHQTRWLWKHTLAYLTFSFNSPGQKSGIYTPFKIKYKCCVNAPTAHFGCKSDISLMTNTKLFDKAHIVLMISHYLKLSWDQRIFSASLNDTQTFPHHTQHWFSPVYNGIAPPF